MCDNFQRVISSYLNFSKILEKKLRGIYNLFSKVNDFKLTTL